jgi:hypothetical protein
VSLRVLCCVHRVRARWSCSDGQAASALSLGCRTCDLDCSAISATGSPASKSSCAFRRDSIRYFIGTMTSSVQVADIRLPGRARPGANQIAEEVVAELESGRMPGTVW